MPSFGPSPDHVELQQWLHTFAAEVIRPAAAEWDEKEEFPWPVVEEAAKVGIYSLDFFATQSFDPTGLGIPIFMEEVLICYFLIMKMKLLNHVQALTPIIQKNMQSTGCIMAL